VRPLALRARRQPRGEDFRRRCRWSTIRGKAVVVAITSESHAIDPAIAVSDVRLLADLLDEEEAGRRLGGAVLVGFALFAALLVVVGIHGVVSYHVVQHTPEIGVRVALGADARDIARLVGPRLRCACFVPDTQVLSGFGDLRASDQA
jgi:ABC-type antimicrobial peptide transport system permease subunit